MSPAQTFTLPLLLVAWASQKPLDEIWIDVFQGGKPVVMAILPFEVRGPGAAEAALEISRVVRDDLEFASVYPIADEKSYPRTVGERLDYKAWMAAGVDVVVTGALTRDGDNLVSEVRVHAVADAKVVFGTVYAAPIESSRRLAHRIADEIVEKSGIAGIAQTQIAFASEKDGKRAIYRMDYDGFGPVRMVEEFLTMAPRWSPDGRSILYASFSTRTSSPVLAMLTAGRGRETLLESQSMVFPGSFSPDGTKVAFSSTHDGNAEIYVVNADGTGLKRLTDHPEIDVSPTWSPTGRELAFTSNRTGGPQIYTIDTEGLNLTRLSRVGSYNAEPAWSPSRDFSEIAYASRIEGAVFDIVVHDLLTHQVRQLTSQRGLNESPSWSPNGRHLVFTSTRSGESQLYTVNRDGSNLRPIPLEGKNTTPNWGPAPR